MHKVKQACWIFKFHVYETVSISQDGKIRSLRKNCFLKLWRSNDQGHKNYQKLNLCLKVLVAIEGKGRKICDGQEDMDEI